MSEDTSVPPQDAQSTPAPEQPQLPEVSATAEDAGQLRKKVTVTVPRKRIDAKVNEMYGEMAKNALVPGFRIGHAPRRLLEKRFGKDIADDVRNSIVGESIPAAMEKVGLKHYLGQPDIKLDEIKLPEADDLTFGFEVEVPPTITLPQLDGIKVKKPKIEIDDTRVNQYLQQWATEQAHFHATEEPAKEGDEVVVDAHVTGAGITAAKRDDVMLRVAPGQVEGIPLMELGKELAGKKNGDKLTINTKVPQVHVNEEWRDKDVSVELTIKQVNARHVPELDDAFAKGLGFDGIAELRDFVRAQLNSRLGQEIASSMREQVCQYLLDSTKFDLPEGVVTRHASYVLQRRLVDLMQRGVPKNQIEEHLTELKASAAQAAERELRLSFILGQVSTERNIEVTDDEVNSRIAQMASQYNRRPERVKQELQEEDALEQVRISIQENKSLDVLLEKAEVSEVEAPAAEEPKKE